MDNSTTTSASSGTAGAIGAAATNQLANTQSSTAQSNGGSGTTTTSNSYTAVVTDAGAVSAQSGFAGAVGSTASTTIDTGGTQLTASASSGLQITPTWPPGTTPTRTATPTPTRTPTVTPTLSGTPTASPLVSSHTLTITNSSTTLAQSGDARAAGVIATNNVSTSSTTAVDVKGKNQGGIQVTTDTQVNVANVGLASATTGDSRAAGAPANVTVSTTAQPAGPQAAGSTTTGATGGTGVLVARSGDVVAVGNTVQNTLVGEQTASRTVTGSTGSGATLSNTQGVALSNSGSANAVSGVACAQCQQATAASTPPPVPAPTPGSILALNNQSLTAAASGDATAAGLIARNDVQSRSKVNVSVEGDNYGLINVVVKFITRILNWGEATARSGDTRATGAPAEVVIGPGGTTPAGGATGAEARSGDATAIGARVENHVAASGKTDVVIEGDNRSPLKIVTRLFAKVFNFGRAASSTGDAIARGSTGSGNNQAVARSGRADALGLEVYNDLQLSSEVNVRLKGSNYARIDVEVYVEADVWNEAYAHAQSGAALAEGGPARAGVPARTVSGRDEGNNDRPSSPSSAATAGMTPTATPRNVARTGETLYVRATTGSAAQASSGGASGTGVSSATLLTTDQTARSNSPGTGRKQSENTTSLDLFTLGMSEVRSGCARTGTLEICPSPTPTPKPQPPQQATQLQGADNSGHNTATHEDGEPGRDGKQVRGPWLTLSDLSAQPWRLVFARPRMLGMPGQLPRVPAIAVVRPAPAPVPQPAPQPAGLWESAEPAILAMPSGLVVERGGPGSMPVPGQVHATGLGRQPAAPPATAAGTGQVQVLPAAVLEQPAAAELSAGPPPATDGGTIEVQAGSPPAPPATARPLDLTCLTWWSLLMLLGTLLYRQRLRLETLFQRVRWRRAQLRPGLLAGREDQA